MMNQTVRLTLSIGIVALIAGVAGIACAPRATQDPTRPAAVDLYVRAMEAYNQGDRAAAIAGLIDATQANPELRMAHSMLGDLYREQGAYARAAPHYEAMTQLDPYHLDNHYRLGVTYHLLARLQDAAAAYLRALQLNPQDMRSNMNLGLVYLSLGQLDDAVTHLERATRLDPNSSVAWSNLGVALDARDSAALAEAAYRRSLELSPLQDSILVNLANNLSRQRKSSEAISLMQQVLQRNDTAANRKYYGDALASAGRYEDAIQQYDRALELDPRYTAALNEKGAAVIQQYRAGMELDPQKRQQAIALWEQSLRINPNQPQVQAMLRRWRSPKLFSE
jgi:tetratricopeptide (TPR) repeat protein